MHEKFAFLLLVSLASAPLLLTFFLWSSGRYDNRARAKCRCLHRDKVRLKLGRTGVRQCRCWEVTKFHSAGSATILLLCSTNSQFPPLRSPRFARTAGKLFYCRLSICSFYTAARPASAAANEGNRSCRVVKAATKERKLPG